MDKCFVRYNKAGGNRRWYGLNEYIIYWKNGGNDLRNTGKAVFRNSDKYFKKCISWGLISTGRLNTRYYTNEFIFDNGAPSLILNENLEFFLGLLNSKVSSHFLGVINPTISFQVGDIWYPSFDEKEEQIMNLVKSSIKISMSDWHSLEKNLMNFKKMNYLTIM